MAASDRFIINVHGKGGHGAVPDGTQDAIVATAHLITMLQTVVSRNVSPLDSAVVTVGTVNAGYAYNVISDHTKITGTCRSFSVETQGRAEWLVCSLVLALRLPFAPSSAVAVALLLYYC